MYITDKDGNYIPSATIQGEDGKEVELRVYNGYIQWKREDTLWTNLINIDVLQGKPGDRILLHAESYIIQYKYETDSEWTNLIDLSEYFGNAAAAKAAASANEAASRASEAAISAESAIDNANSAAELARQAAADTGNVAHASRHAFDGEDPITPNMIGAAEKDHTHELEESDPTVPSWAKQPNKPTYTAAEVGAAEAGHTHTYTYLECPVSVLGWTVPVSDWVTDITYADYPYRATISNPNFPVSEYSFVDVMFSVDDATSGNFAPGGDTGDNTIYIYAKQIPEADIRLERIIYWKGL